MGPPESKPTGREQLVKRNGYGLTLAGERCFNTFPLYWFVNLGRITSYVESPYAEKMCVGKDAQTVRNKTLLLIYTGDICWQSILVARHWVEDANPL